jgi:hypothetical protein
MEPQNIDVYIDGNLIESFGGVLGGQPFGTSAPVVMGQCSNGFNSFPYHVVATTMSCGISAMVDDQILVSCRPDSSCGGTLDCSMAEATRSLWPPNHKFVEVGIVGVTDSQGDPVSIEITGVTTDEPVLGLGDGNTCADAILNGETAMLRAERSGTGNGRVYTLYFTASNAAGNSCDGSVTVCITHDRSGADCIKDEPQYDATICPGDEPPDDRDPGRRRILILNDTARGVGMQFAQAQSGPVEITVYDSRGRLVRRLTESQSFGAGTHTVWWNGKNSSGLRVSTGMYFVRLRTQDREEAVKVVWTK